MYILLRFFNSVILMLVNFLMAIYFGRRFFAVMVDHYRLVAEIMEFNSIVSESRDSLDYTTAKISEVMKEMEADIGQELYTTHNLTKLSSKMSILLKRYAEVEERVLELVRLSNNVESVQIETPRDIKTEVKRLLAQRKKAQLEHYTKSLTPTTDNPLTGGE